eukprot:scaffold6446_cov104-Isochrysis_galbana.AAC.9
MKGAEESASGPLPPHVAISSRESFSTGRTAGAAHRPKAKHAAYLKNDILSGAAAPIDVRSSRCLDLFLVCAAGTFDSFIPHSSSFFSGLRGRGGSRLFAPLSGASPPPNLLGPLNLLGGGGRSHRPPNAEWGAPRCFGVSKCHSTTTQRPTFSLGFKRASRVPESRACCVLRARLRLGRLGGLSWLVRRLRGGGKSVLGFPIVHPSRAPRGDGLLHHHPVQLARSKVSGGWWWWLRIIYCSLLVRERVSPLLR